MASDMQERVSLYEEEPPTGNSSQESSRPKGLIRAKKEEEPRAEYRRRLCKQICIVVMGALGHFCLGTVLTWPSPALADLGTHNETLTGTELSLTETEKDVTGSLASLGSLFGSYIAGWFVSKLGRRRSLQLNALPFISGWLMTGLAPSAPVLLLGRFLLGIGVGLSTVAGTAYIMEVADAKFRGTMSIVPSLIIVIGGQVYTCSWHCIALASPLSSVFGTRNVPTTRFFPLTRISSFLVIKHRRAEAAVVLKQLRGNYADIDEEIDDLERRNRTTGGEDSGYRALLKANIIKRMGVVIALFLFKQLSGNYVLIVQTGRVLEATGTPFRPATAASIAVGMRLAGTTTAFFLIDRIGRKYCLVTSHAVNAISLTILGVYVYSSDGSLPWVPMVCVSVSLFIADLGLHPVPYMLAAEYFPTNVRIQVRPMSVH
ncbi:hypothetical protein SK128_011750, partial [Halocaridina rubra]